VEFAAFAVPCFYDGVGPAFCFADAAEYKYAPVFVYFFHGKGVYSPPE
jgi:hypothetical protein